jgi:hypothetical protein
MYFPYLRGRQEELLALREIARSLPDTVVPIFKPTVLSHESVQRYASMASDGLRFALITNSNEGAPPPTEKAAWDTIDGALQAHAAMVFPAFELRADVPLTSLRAFTKKYANRQCLIVHRNHAYTAAEVTAHLALATPPAHAYLSGGVPTSLQKALPSRVRILIRDGFDRHVPNGDYPPATSFDDLVFTYAALGYGGFGDFSVIGDYSYSPGGGAAKHVAIHLSEKQGQTNIITRHFVSRTPPTTKDPDAKYFDALTQLLQHVGNPPAPRFATAGVKDYAQTLNPPHYPGLGKLKRWSIEHHTELVASILVANGAVALM